MLTIGADEVGSGDTFCGLVVSAVCLNEEQEAILKAQGVRDSKRIGNTMIGAHVSLMASMGIKHSTLVLDPHRFNQLLTSQIDHVDVQNDLFSKAIANLIGKVGRPERVYVDQYPGAKITVDHLPIELSPRAEEKYVSVAAASIMARSAYLGMRRMLAKELGMEIPLGSSNVREALMSLITKQVDISRYAKMYPSNVKEILRGAI